MQTHDDARATEYLNPNHFQYQSIGRLNKTLK